MTVIDSIWRVRLQKQFVLRDGLDHLTGLRFRLDSTQRPHRETEHDIGESLNLLRYIFGRTSEITQLDGVLLPNRFAQDRLGARCDLFMPGQTVMTQMEDYWQISGDNRVFEGLQELLKKFLLPTSTGSLFVMPIEPHFAEPHYFRSLQERLHPSQ